MSQDNSTSDANGDVQPPTTVELDDPATLLQIAHSEAKRALETGAFDELSVALLLDSARAARDQLENPPEDINTLITELEDTIGTEDAPAEYVPNAESLTVQAEAACESIRTNSTA